MSDVVPFKRPPAPASALKTSTTLKDHFGNDDWMLRMCAEWRAARAQQQKNWAEHELATGWGHLPDKGDLDLTPLQRMDYLEDHLSQWEPRTILLARELLGMCITILAYKNEDPKSVLAEGPVLEILRNVVASLEDLSGDMPIGRAARERRKRRKVNKAP